MTHPAKNTAMVHGMESNGLRKVKNIETSMKTIIIELNHPKKTKLHNVSICGCMKLRICPPETFPWPVQAPLFRRRFFSSNGPAEAANHSRGGKT